MRRLSMPFAVQHRELVEEHRRVHHDAVADDGHDPRVQDAARDELQLEDLAVDHQRVPGVVAALVADAQRGLFREVVGEAALAFVAPLGTDDHRARHGPPPLGRPGPRTGPAHNVIALTLGTG